MVLKVWHICTYNTGNNNVVYYLLSVNWMSIKTPFKGIVSRDWGQIHWISSDRSEEFRVTRAYFYVFLSKFLWFTSKKSGLSGFLLSNYSANDKQQPRIGTGDQWSLADRRSKQRVQFRSQKTWKNGGNHPASNVTIDFFIWGVTYLLKNQSYMYKNDGWDWSAVVTHHPKKTRVTVKWEIGKLAF